MSADPPSSPTYVLLPADSARLAPPRHRAKNDGLAPSDHANDFSSSSSSSSSTTTTSGGCGGSAREREVCDARPRSVTYSLGECFELRVEEDGTEANCCDWFFVLAAIAIAISTTLVALMFLTILVFPPEPNGPPADLEELEFDNLLEDRVVNQLVHSDGSIEVLRVYRRRDYYTGGEAGGDGEAFALTIRGVLQLHAHVMMGIMMICFIAYAVSEIVQYGVPLVLGSCCCCCCFWRRKKRPRPRGARCRCRGRGALDQRRWQRRKSKKWGREDPARWV